MKGVFDIVAMHCVVLCRAQSEEGKPNIIFIMADDHTYQAISADGHEVGRLAVKARYIDRLARKALLLPTVLLPIQFVNGQRIDIGWGTKKLTGKEWFRAMSR